MIYPQPSFSPEEHQELSTDYQTPTPDHEVYIKEIAPKIYDAACEWDNFPPSEKDNAEYKEKVVPRVVPAMERLKAQKN
jgi:hypothetical protein